jgi:putative membrane protein
MEWVKLLPTVNACLNATSAVLLMFGYRNIRMKRIETHRRFMLAACATSTLFLISYLFYHSVAGSTRFTGVGWVRPLYFSILLSHTILAVAVLPLAIYSVVQGLRMRVEPHRRVSRWTLPVWLYVSVTGVLVYLFLYHFFPSR